MHENLADRITGSNDFITRSTNLLTTTQGTGDPNTANTSARVGDSVMCSGVSIKMMLELNERYSMGTFRIFVVKCAKGDTPTKATLFTGLSANKMIDTINTERYSMHENLADRITGSSYSTREVFVHL